MKSGSCWGFGTCEVAFLKFFQMFHGGKMLILVNSCLEIARNRIPRPVFPRLPFVFGTVSAERFADSFGCHCQHVLRHIDVTPLPRACVDQKPGTLCCQTAWHVFLHVLPTLIYHASVKFELCLPSFDPFWKLSFGMVHVIMIDATTTCYLMCVCVLLERYTCLT